MKRIHKIIAAVIAAVAAAIPYFYWENNSLTVSNYTYETQKAGKSLDGFKIVHISDLHNKRFGRKNSRLIKLIREQSPDIIVISGDIADSRHTDIAAAVEFVSEASEVAPVYYTTGNHEHRFSSEKFDRLISGIRSAGGTVLLDETAVIERGDEKLYITGLADSSLHLGKLDGIMPKAPDCLSLLISHQPQFIDFYTESGADITFCGHAHGGQFRIPGIGGFIAPGQGFFPKYTERMHRRGDTAVVISRGLGSSVIPSRINNRPEVVVVTIKSAQ